MQKKKLSLTLPSHTNRQSLNFYGCYSRHQGSAFNLSYGFISVFPLDYKLSLGRYHVLFFLCIACKKMVELAEFINF